MRHSLAITLDQLRCRAPSRASTELTVDEMIRIRNSVASELKGKMVSLEDIRYRAFKRTVESVGCANESFAAELNALYLKYRFDDIELYPDVVPALETLRDDFSHCLISNGNGHPDRCGLPGRFGVVVFSQDVGVEKPDPAIFGIACRQAGCEPADLMHVGDSLQSDVAGANAAGAVSVWLNRNASENRSEIRCHYEIQSLFELADIVVLHRVEAADARFTADRMDRNRS